MHAFVYITINIIIVYNYTAPVNFIILRTKRTRPPPVYGDGLISMYDDLT